MKKQQPMTLRLPTDLHTSLRKEAFDLKVSLNELIVTRLMNPTVKCITCSVEPAANCQVCTVVAYKLGEEKGYGDAYDELK